MATSGKKRVRKEKSDEALKKQKASEAKEAVVATTKGAAGPVKVVTAPVVIKQIIPERRKPQKSSVPASAEKELLGNPYEEKRPVAVKEAPTPGNKPTKTDVMVEASSNGNVTMDQSYKSPVKKRKTSVPSILLFLVAFLLCCSVILLGFHLSKRLDRHLLLFESWVKSEAVCVRPPPAIEGLQKNLKQSSDTARGTTNVNEVHVPADATANGHKAFVPADASKKVHLQPRKVHLEADSAAQADVIASVTEGSCVRADDGGNG
jgi:hypothetical protein